MISLDVGRNIRAGTIGRVFILEGVADAVVKKYFGEDIFQENIRLLSPMRQYHLRLYGIDEQLYD